MRWLSRHLNLRLRLSLMISALLALAAAAGGVFIIQQARENIRAEVRSTIDLTGHYLDAELDNMRSSRGIYYDPDAPLFHLNRLRRVRHLEISYYDADGRLMEVSATAPLDAQVPHWFKWLVSAFSPPMADVRRSVDLNGLSLGTLVMHPDPAFEIEKMWQLTHGLLELLLVFFLVVNIMVWWAVSRALRPIGGVLTALGEIERGNLQARLPRFTLPEMLRLSAAFNVMAQALERSTRDNRRLTRRLIELQEQERRYLARELHDEIGQCITAIHADAAAIRDAGAAQRPVREGAEAIMQVAGNIKQLVRGMLQRLRPATLDRLGLQPALRELVADFRERHPDVRCTLTVNADDRTLDDEHAITLYRAVQEGLTNVARYAQAAQVAIDLKVPAVGDVELRLRDDGRGFDPAAVSGFGLSGMRERVQVLGGQYRLDSAPGQGTRIYIRLPATAVVA